MPEFDGVVFDMDGLLIDTEATYVHAWRLAARFFGVELSGEFLNSLSGLHADDVESRLAEKMGARFERESFRIQSARIWQERVAAAGIVRMPGADEILGLLVRSGTPYALATNSEFRFASRCLRYAGFAGRFSVMVCRDEVAAGKPAPDLFIEAARQLGVAIERCLVLEDSPVGILAAARSGAIPVLVNRRQVPVEIRGLARAWFPSLGEVAECIAGFRQR